MKKGGPPDGGRLFLCAEIILNKFIFILTTLKGRVIFELSTNLNVFKK